MHITKEHDSRRRFLIYEGVVAPTLARHILTPSAGKLRPVEHAPRTHAHAHAHRASSTVHHANNRS